MQNKIKKSTKVLVNAIVLLINILITIFFPVDFHMSAASILPLAVLGFMLFISYTYSRYPEQGEVNFHVEPAWMNKELKIATYHIISEVAMCFVSFQLYLLFFYSDLLKVVFSVFGFFFVFIVGNLVSHKKLKPVVKKIVEKEQEELKRQKMNEELGVKF